jgi:hypothetical protein
MTAYLFDRVVALVFSPLWKSGVVAMCMLRVYLSTSCVAEIW